MAFVRRLAVTNQPPMSVIKWKASSLLMILALLVAVPVLLDQWYSAKQARQDSRDDELEKQFECEPPEKCLADFDGDGTSDKVSVQPNSAERFDLGLVVSVNGGEVLRLPYDHTDNTLRTHTAVRREDGTYRLLVYDKASRKETVAAFGWDGSKMLEVVPTALDREILTAMGAHDDTGGWNERAVFRPFRRMLRLGIYFFLLAIVTGVVIYKRHHRLA